MCCIQVPLSLMFCYLMQRYSYRSLVSKHWTTLTVTAWTKHFCVDKFNFLVNYPFKCPKTFGSHFIIIIIVVVVLNISGADLQVLLTWHFLVLHHWKSVRRGQTGVTFGHLEVSRNGTTPSQKYLKETKVYNEKQWTFLQLLGQERDEAQERQN